MLLWIAAACFALSMPCVLLGVLGLLGIVADVSPDENRSIGLGFLRFALIPIGIGVAILAAALAGRRSRHK